MEYGIYGAVATLAFGVIVHAVRATWALSRVEKELKEFFDAQIDNLQRDVSKLERAGMERAEILRHEFGETGAALRTKIHEVETWNRDTFVRKESFDLIVARIEKSMEKLGDRFEEKIDKLVERIQQH
jgi:hypothetical protein